MAQIEIHPVKLNCKSKQMLLITSFIYVTVWDIIMHIENIQAR